MTSSGNWPAVLLKRASFLSRSERFSIKCQSETGAWLLERMRCLD